MIDRQLTLNSSPTSTGDAVPFLPPATIFALPRCPTPTFKCPFYCLANTDIQIASSALSAKTQEQGACARMFNLLHCDLEAASACRPSNALANGGHRNKEHAVCVLSLLDCSSAPPRASLAAPDCLWRLSALVAFTLSPVLSHSAEDDGAQGEHPLCPSPHSRERARQPLP